MKSKRAILIELLVAYLGITVSTSRAQIAQVSAVSLADPGSSAGVSAGGDSFAQAVTPDGAFVLFTSLANNLVTNQCDGVNFQVFLRCRTNGLTRLVSVNADGAAGGDGDSFAVGVTPDGRFVAFESDAGDLVSNDFNGAGDVFVRDVVTGTTRLVSGNDLATGSGNGASFDPVITPDGRYVAFASDASDLVGQDANNFPDIFVCDLQTGVTTLVSVGGRDGNTGMPHLSGAPAITPDGRYVAFTSTASNLVSSAYKTLHEVYVRDLVSGHTICASTNVSAASRPYSLMPELSDDGRYVSFKTSTGSEFLIFRRDLQTGTLDVISTAAAGGAWLSADPFGPAMTPDGRFVAFSAEPTNGIGSVWVWDAVTQSATLARANLSGQPSTNGICDTPAISPDGRFVVFLSNGTDLVTNGVNGGFQVYLRDLQVGRTKLVSADALGAGSGNLESSIPALTADGRFVLFESPSQGFVSGDANDAYDVFLRNTVDETNELVSSIAPGMIALTANGASSISGDGVSADGRYVVFASTATDLAPGTTTNELKQIYLRDRQTGTTTLVSVNRFGTGAGDGYSSEASLSAAGRYVVFLSDAEDLVSNDTNRLTDVFVRDILAGVTTLVSVATNGWSANRLSEAPSISAEGHWVAFQSPANNLAPNDADSFSYDVFVRDLEAGTTILASTNFPGDSFSPSHSSPLVSPDGNYVAFQSYTATAAVRVKNLQTGATTAITLNSISDLAFSGNSRLLAIVGRVGSSYVLLVADLIHGTNTTVGIDLGTPSSQCVSLNADGRYAAFVSRSPLVGTDTNNTDDVFVCDLTTQNLTLISARPGGSIAGNDRSYQPCLTADGRLVVFRSFAGDLVSDDNNATSDLFQHDRITGQTTAITHRHSDAATASGMSLGFAMASGANCIAFTSIANDLIVGDANADLDVFAAELDLGAPKVSVAFVGGQTILAWPATPILPSRVQYKDSLYDSGWHDLGASVIVNGTSASVVDATAGSAPQRFYRLVWWQ